MRRRALLWHLKQHGCDLLREGSKHSLFWNPANRSTSAVPRHAEIPDRLARKICKDLGIPSPSEATSGQRTDDEPSGTGAG